MWEKSGIIEEIYYEEKSGCFCHWVDWTGNYCIWMWSFQCKGKRRKYCPNLTEADYWGLRNWNAYEYVDPDTGVHYLALYSENNGDVTSLTPRLNSDGTVMVDKENKK